MCVGHPEENLYEPNIEWHDGNYIRNYDTTAVAIATLHYVSAI